MNQSEPLSLSGRICASIRRYKNGLDYESLSTETGIDIVKVKRILTRLKNSGYVSKSRYGSNSYLWRVTDLPIKRGSTECAAGKRDLILKIINKAPLTTFEISKKTGLSIDDVRKKLKRLREEELVLRNDNHKPHKWCDSSRGVPFSEIKLKILNKIYKGPSRAMEVGRSLNIESDLVRVWMNELKDDGFLEILQKEGKRLRIWKITQLGAEQVKNGFWTVGKKGDGCKEIDISSVIMRWSTLSE